MKKIKKRKKQKNSKQFNRQFKKKFFTKKSAIIIICTVVILGAFGIGYQKVEKKAAKYQKTIDELKTDVKNIEQTNKTLEKENKGIDTDEFKERIARERLGMIKEGEISLQEAKEGEEASIGISSEDTSVKKAVGRVVRRAAKKRHRQQNLQILKRILHRKYLK